MILRRLKEHTQAQHERVEALVRVMDDPLTLQQYREVLGSMAGFYLPLEAQLSDLDLPQVFRFEARRKSALLRRDLQVLGLSQTAHAARAQLPALSTVAHALGCLYVLEGATLGGRIIARHVERQLQLTPENGAAFFASYGDTLGVMWKEFGAALSGYAAEHGGESEILQGAERTFGALERWLRRTETAPA
ncbi:biliverdin-producing heme oxygenase [Deinococcus peraridilitoris]|uniref:Heme oxygenase n=1 Tax=Deinococcus peraridilitoris (strain DSM 19664 / LMG 22246 / CIP 109416 / KR-200) TaxID=937777 RepID=L0A459_DEIPD|nr:biliverdin-producing heme oxygenase [Deinococcus peraridilitoris]AFZ68214.1 heme oxygenase [Deinococcus peraridilitoris DSM 19664]